MFLTQKQKQMKTNLYTACDRV